MTAEGLAPLDPRALDELRAQVGDAVADRVLTSYLEELPRHLEALRRALERGDGDGLFRAAHSLKGASQIIGGGQLATRCQEVEEAARSGRLDGGGGAVAEIERLAGELERAITVRLQG